ncbi:hypothetical protein MIR68_012578 [Amoeboaphelidium protococcarum]|nr:hypothetical protein MIR68_012578 [Amoeboaphelidium protococcarum]
MASQYVQWNLQQTEINKATVMTWTKKYVDQPPVDPLRGYKIIGLHDNDGKIVQKNRTQTQDEEAPSIQEDFNAIDESDDEIEREREAQKEQQAHERQLDASDFIIDKAAQEKFV